MYSWYWSPPDLSTHSGKFLLKVVSLCNHSLVSLDVSGCFQVDDLTIGTVLTTCPKLTNINIRNCRKLTDETLESLGKLDTRLQSLNIGGNFNMTVKGVQAFLNHSRYLGELRELHISGLMITDDILTSVASSCRGLTAVGIGFADVSEAGLLKLFLGVGPQLLSLNVSWLSSATAQIGSSFLIDCIAVHCPHLVELDISGLKNFSATNIAQLLETRLLQVSEAR